MKHTKENPWEALHRKTHRGGGRMWLWLAPLCCGVFCAVCVLLSGVLTPAADTPSQPAATSNLLQLVPEGRGTPVALSVTSTSGDFTLQTDGDTIILGDGTAADTDKAKALLACGSSILARNRVSGDAADFGLGSGQGLTAMFTYAAGETLTLRLGDAPATGEGRYAMIDGDDDCYVVNASLYTILSAQEESLLPLPDLTGWLSAEKLMTVTLTQPDRETIAIRRVTESNPFNMVAELTEPFAYPANSERTAALFLALADIAPTGIASRGGETEVDALLADITLGFEEETHQLTLARSGENILLLLDDDPAVYTLASGSADFLTNATVAYLAEQLPGLVMMNQVSEVAVTRGSERYVLRIDHSGDSALYTVGGTEVSEDDFRTLYQQMIGLLVDRYQQGDTEIDSEHAAFAYTLTDGTVWRLSFGVVDHTYDLVKRGGEGHFLISASKVDAVVDAVRDCQKGESYE